MTDLDKLAVTLQYRINHARNNHLKTVTIFTQTLSQCLAAVHQCATMEPVPPDKIPGLTIEKCGSCHGIITVDMNYCPKCGKKVKR